MRNKDIPVIRKNEVLKLDTKFEASMPVVEYILFIYIGSPERLILLQHK
jgi:hypothetical protein